ncbi:MAG: hypothetical protein V4556_14710 [Bacteroidota bacterium]
MINNHDQFSNSQKQLFYTYIDGRKCLFCGEPIADQESTKRTFCEKTYNALGKVRDCKTAYHRKNDKPERDIHRSIINEHKSIDERIEEMIIKKGFEVTTEDLDAYDIDLSSSIRYNLKATGVLESFYLFYKLTSNPITNVHKIKKHEEFRFDANPQPDQPQQ